MSGNSKRINALLWTIQGLLALLFSFAGVMKFILPANILQQGPIVLPLLFLKFIGVCELLGALGLILPGVFKVHRELTPLAAAGLVTIMAGATTITIIGMGVGPAVTPFVAGVLSAVVCLGRGDTTLRIGRGAKLEAAYNH